MNYSTFWRESAIRKSYSILPPKDRAKVLLISGIQISLSVLDLLGVLAIGLLGTLSAYGIQSQKPQGRVLEVLQFLGLSESTFRSQVLLLGLGALILLVSRTVISIIFTRKILFFLGHRGARLSAQLVSRLLAQPLLFVQKRTTQEMLYAVTNGVSIITLQILATAIVMLADLALLFVMSLGLLLIDPVTAILTITVFAGVGFILNQLMGEKARTLGELNATFNTRSNEKILEVFNSYRESVVRNRRAYYAKQIANTRYALADITSENAFMPYVSKYVIETTVILGAVFVGVIQFVIADVSQAFSTLAIFLAAGARVAPAVLRIQQGSVLIRGSLGSARPTFDLIEELPEMQELGNSEDDLDTVHKGFVPKIELQDITFTYPGNESPAISNICLSVPPGTSLAIVGSSGSGKTTLIDLLLGVLLPDTGRVMISGYSPADAVTRWPGAISYVPQDVVINSGTIRENVALGYPVSTAKDGLVQEALNVAHLTEFVSRLPKGLDTRVGENGSRISGGQRQRLGIARAMFTKPNLLVLDEATSSLDGETEANVSEAIHSLRGLTTVVVIAHRLSTVKSADLVLYIDGGKIVAKGTFEEVRKSVSDFDKQARLLGL